MKHIITIITTLILATALDARTTEDLVRTADAMYRDGDYPASIEAYEAILASGQSSADLYYNLGNAYYRTGEIGHSILNYERALRLKPNMRDAKENLALANSKTADRIAQLPQLFVVRWIDWLCTALSPAAWRTLWLVLLAVIGVALVLFRLGHTIGIRKAALIGGTSALLLLIVATLLLLSATSRYNAHSHAIVMEQSVTVKSSPEHQSVDKLILHEGTKVEIMEQLSGWYKIRIADGTSGWCETQTLERI